MAKILLAYYSRTGNTEKMAALIRDTLSGKGHAVDFKKVTDVEVDALPEYDGIILGTPVYYGGMAAEVKTLLDESVKLHGRLDGKAGGAFSTSANVGGGNETAVMQILEAMLIHGMVVQGDPAGDHYGPVAIGAPDARAEKNCRRFAERFSRLLERLA